MLSSFFSLVSWEQDKIKKKLFKSWLNLCFVDTVLVINYYIIFVVVENIFYINLGYLGQIKCRFDEMLNIYKYTSRLD